ncbi:hypothetical protein AAFF_G00068470 [Aldrovandia affinis]|uniref:Uncharacterized protein n=1 Tax=Aldrovandia affinis TaxID=143900 RepID=A0AAD7WEM8_9TELE|nr:hypothetical protein AAFF_G00068470 [Aldrovandia affinis]
MVQRDNTARKERGEGVKSSKYQYISAKWEFTHITNTPEQKSTERDCDHPYQSHCGMPAAPPRPGQQEARKGGGRSRGPCLRLQ